MTVQAVREFNRFYTNAIGALDYQGHLGTPYSLTEARVLYELAHHERLMMADLRSSLSLDAGYLSRMLARFEKAGLITRERSDSDARQQLVSLTAGGREAAALLEERSSAAVSELLATVSPADRERLASGMRTVREALQGSPRPRSFLLRDPGPGDLGWIVHRHGALYAAEYGWNTEFETLVARIVAGFAEHQDPTAERLWIAEMGGEPVGSVFCVRGERPGVAKLRLLLVEPTARGLGIGARLVAECIRFARERGYRELHLWTNDVLVSARRIYQKAGFTLVASEPHRSFGKDLVGQDWSLTL